ncbi:MAG: DUF2384 domain-containing protein [Polyangiaceae bacterium]
MALAQHYPATRYSPSPLVDLSSKAERERLSPAALRAFFNMMERWGVPDKEARALLGGISNGPFYELKKALLTRAPAHPVRVLETDRLQRISYLVGIFKALNVLYSEKLADAWLRLANENPIFVGQTPLSYMIQGGLPAMQVVRRLLDARRGGR